MEIDPVIALASSMHSAPGTFALLLGSGVSRTAEIPTGWDVVVDLLGRVALLTDGERPSDPIEWYRIRHGGDPNYSEVLEALAATPADRRNLLNGYFEPTEEERERGAKLPTAAHRAVARLVASGYVRVIVTTNFDRLLEAALRGAGIEPVVISSPAAAAGAEPLAHSRCTIIKVHGDYLDPDLKNTIDELGAYDPAIDALLDRVFDEYGLVICGWSGDWDSALRNAILRASSRRYGCYWTHVGAPGEYAQRLTAHRRAVAISIVGADDFLESLSSKVTALAAAADHQPLSTAIAVEELKRYLPERRHRIRLRDLMIGEAARVLALPEQDMNGAQPTVESVSKRMSQYEAASATLVSLLAGLAFFADQPEHDDLAVEVLRRVARAAGPASGFTIYIKLQTYPATLALYALGLGAVARGRLEPFARACASISIGNGGQPEPVFIVAAPWRVLDPQICSAVVAPGENRSTPISDYLQRLMAEQLRDVIAVGDDFDDIFDEFEYLLGVVLTASYGRAALGRFVWRRAHDRPRRLGHTLDEHADALLNVGLFNGDPEAVTAARQAYDSEASGSGLSW